MTNIHMKLLDVDQANLLEKIERETNLVKKLELYQKLTETLLIKDKIYQQQLENFKQHEITEEHY